jgi:hypothetical protein
MTCGHCYRNVSPLLPENGTFRVETCRSDIVLIKLCFNIICVHSSVFDLDSQVSFRVNEQRVAIRVVVLENLRGRFRGNITSFASRPHKTRQESLWLRVSYKRCTPQHVLRLQTCLAMIRNGRYVRRQGGRALCQ